MLNGDLHAFVDVPEQCIKKAIDILFIVDSSQSIGQANYALEQQFVANVVSGLDIGPGNTQTRYASASWN